MIRALHPTDVFRRLFLKDLRGENLAQSQEQLMGAKPSEASRMAFFRESLSVHRDTLTLVAPSASRLSGLASIRSRSGPRAWEVTSLYLAPDCPDTCMELLEGIGPAVARLGAERVFLRLRQEEPLLDSVRRAGFLPAYEESIYTGCGKDTVAQSETAAPLRPKEAKDDYPLFRLYNAATPAKMRPALGLTLEEWRDSRERGPARRVDMVYGEGDGIKGLISTSNCGKRGWMELMVLPEDTEALRAMIDYGLAQLGGGTSVMVLVPEYQLPLQRILEDEGFTRALDCVTMVRALGVRVEKKKPVPAGATPI